MDDLTWLDPDWPTPDLFLPSRSGQAAIARDAGTREWIERAAEDLARLSTRRLTAREVERLLVSHYEHWKRTLILR